MKDYNSDFHYTSENDGTESNMTSSTDYTTGGTSFVTAEPNAEQVVYEQPQASTASQSATYTSPEPEQTGYFNRLHEEKSQSSYTTESAGDPIYHHNYTSQPAEDSTYRYSHTSQPAEDSTYHYSYRRETKPEQEAAATYHSYEEPPKKKSRKKKSRFGRFARLLASALVFGLVAGAAFQGFNFVYYKVNPSANPANNAISSTSTLNIKGDTISTSTDLSVMVENVMPATVSITSTVEQQVNYGFWGSTTEEVPGAGSGIIIGQNDTELLVVTNYHVIEDTTSLSVGFIDETDAEATVKGYDSDADLAVVSVALDKLSAETKAAIKVATLGKSSELKLGEPAIAIGNALGYGQSVTVGYVSALDREVALTDKTMTLLQTDAAINPGNSGGALLNIRGEVIGINTVKYSDTTVEGMGYAIPIDTAAPIIEALMNKEVVPESQQAYLGITGIDIDESYSQQLNLPEGIYIQSVQENSPADRGGVHAGDVITEYNGNNISSMEALINKMENNRAGDEITLTVKRMTTYGKYEETELHITLGSKSEME